MNYEQEFEILALLYPITPREHVIAAKAIINSRETAILDEIRTLQATESKDTRLVELAIKGLNAELDLLHSQLCEICGRLAQVEEEKSAPRRGRKPGSKNKPKPLVVDETIAAGSVKDGASIDVTHHSEGFCRQCGMGGDRCVCAEVRGE